MDEDKTMNKYRLQELPRIDEVPSKIDSELLLFPDRSSIIE
jgi:hypothetical protein